MILAILIYLLILTQILSNENTLVASPGLHPLVEEREALDMSYVLQRTHHRGRIVP